MISLNSKVKIEGNEHMGSGIVRYIGEIEGMQGNFVGIELSEKKGRNNGSVKEKSYFTCRQGYGVFAKYTSVKLFNENDTPESLRKEKKGMTIPQMLSKIVSRCKLLITALRASNHPETKLQYQKLKKRIAIFFKKSMEENSNDNSEYYKSCKTLYDSLNAINDYCYTNIGKKYFRDLEKIKTRVREDIAIFKKNYAQLNTVQNDSQINSSSTKMIIENLKKTVNEEEMKGENERMQQSVSKMEEMVQKNYIGDEVLSKPTITISRSGINEFLSPFFISQSSALELFDKWRNSLWFCPLDYKLRRCLLDLKVGAFFAPYFLYSTTTQSIHKGKIGFRKQNRTEMELKEESVFNEQSYSNMKATAYDENDLPCSQSMLEEIENWTLKKQVPLDKNNKNEIKFIPISSEASIWEDKIAKELNDFQSNSAFDALKTNFPHAHYWEPISTKTEYVDTKCKTLYLPLYVISYKFEEINHIFLVNGETGVCTGSRPYAFKSSLIKIITFNYFNQSNKSEIRKGSLLNKIANSEIYDPNIYYLTFPPSDQYLFYKFTGTILIRNSSNKSVTLQSQRRGTPKKITSVAIDKEEEEFADFSDIEFNGTVYEMKPNSTEGFDYVGDWVIAILFGEHDKISVQLNDTNGGKLYSIISDHLGMTKLHI